MGHMHSVVCTTTGCIIVQHGPYHGLPHGLYHDVSNYCAFSLFDTSQGYSCEKLHPFVLACYQLLCFSSQYKGMHDDVSKSVIERGAGPLALGGHARGGNEATPPYRSSDTVSARHKLVFHYSRRPFQRTAESTLPTRNGIIAAATWISDSPSVSLPGADGQSSSEARVNFRLSNVRRDTHCNIDHSTV